MAAFVVLLLYGSSPFFDLAAFLVWLDSRFNGVNITSEHVSFFVASLVHWLMP